MSTEHSPIRVLPDLEIPAAQEEFTELASEPMTLPLDAPAEPSPVSLEPLAELTPITKHRRERLTGIPQVPGMLEHLVPFMRSSIVVVDREARVKDSLGPPAGMLGEQAAIGANVLDFCHPDDLPKSLEFAVWALGTEPGWEGRWTARLRTASGEWHTYDLLIANRLDDPVIDGFVIRIEESTRPPEQRSEDERITDQLDLESIASAVQVPILLFGVRGLAYFANDSARALCGDAIDLVKQSGLAAIAAPEERAYVAEALTRRFDVPGDTTITFHLDPTGEARKAPVIEAQLSARGRRHVHAVVATLADVSDRQQTEAELRLLANLDPLTELPNRRSLYQLLEDRLAIDPEGVGLIFCDLDGFKRVNDTFGHDVGDELLVAIARALRAHMRPDDVVGRVGGDEFVVVAANLPIDRLIELGNRILGAVTSVGESRSLAISASLGIAVGGSDDTARDLVNRADRAMYRDKFGHELTAIDRNR